MKLLMITRKVDKDDHLAGFAYVWVKKLGELLQARGGKLSVICLEKGNVEGLEEIEIFSLGKEVGSGKLSELVKFQSLALRIVREVDGVFCHMNPEYTIAIVPYALAFRKKIVSWYTHSAVTWRMRLMEKLADVILTASKDSFRLPSPKVNIVGHGIDVDAFQPQHATHNGQRTTFRIVSVGRISPTKDYETMIKAVALLREKGALHVRLKIIGDVGLPSHDLYRKNLFKLVDKLGLVDCVDIAGPVSHGDIPRELDRADCFVNLSGTGSLDKAVLEAMACECLVITGNEAFRDILPENLFVERNNPGMLEQRLAWLMTLSDQEKQSLRPRLRAIVVRDHNLDRLVQRIIDQFTPHESQTTKT